MHLKAIAFLFVPFIDQAIDLVIACLQVWVQCFCLSKCLRYGVICVIITTYLKKLMEEKITMIFRIANIIGTSHLNRSENSVQRTKYTFFFFKNPFTMYTKDVMSPDRFSFIHFQCRDFSSLPREPCTSWMCKWKTGFTTTGA